MTTEKGWRTPNEEETEAVAFLQGLQRSVGHADPVWDLLVTRIGIRTRSLMRRLKHERSAVHADPAVVAVNRLELFMWRALAEEQSPTHGVPDAKD